jgi:PAS domain S-box-containing protein
LRLLASSVAAAAATVRRTELLAELDRAKTAFFANVSHEFRTPLTLMLGPLEECSQATDVPEDRRAALGMAHRNSLRLLRLVNTLLDFSRIEAGRTEAVFAKVDIAALTEDLTSNFRAAIERAGMSLAVRCETPVAPVFVDRSMWEKIVLNLLSNAFKFTFRGGISVSLADRGSSIELAVSDTGVGIPSDEVPHVFERFHRVRGTTGRTHEGTGIGLALVNELVRLHGGTITVKSDLGVGTVFTVRIPTGSAHLPREQIGDGDAGRHGRDGAALYVEEAHRWLPEEDARDERGALARESSVTTAGARLLVVDDNADMRSYLKRLLAPYWDVETVSDGETAFAAILRRPPDLVISDVMMPRLDGILLTEAIRSTPALIDLPVLLLSARAGEESRVEGFAARADDYLTKPFSARELIARVDLHIALARMRSKADAIVKASEARLHAFVSASADVVFRVSRDWTETRQLVGRNFIPDTTEASGSWVGRYIDPGDQPMVWAAIKRAIETKTVFAIEHRVRRVDGTLGWMSSRAIPLFDENGDIVEWFGTATDITPRREAEERARAAARELEQTLATAGVGLTRCSRDLRYVSANPAYAKLLGRPIEDFVGRSIVEVLGEAGFEKIRPYVERVLAGETIEYETEVARRDGGIMFVHAVYTPWRDDSGRVSGWVASVADVTTRWRVEETLRLTEDRYRLALRGTPVAVWECDTDLRFTFVDNAQPPVTDPARILGKRDDEILPPESVAEMLETKRRVLATGRGERREICVLVDGDERYFDYIIEPLRDRTDRIVGLRGVAVDVTERLQREAALTEAAKRTDEFLAMLAHELRNPLAPIRNAVTVLRALGPGDDRLKSARDVIDRQASHMTRLVDDLLDVSRITRGKIDLKRAVISLADVVADAVETVRPMITQHAHTLSVTLGSETIRVHADRARLAQAIANLLTNAAKFTPRGGHITVHAEVSDGGEASVRVRDTGIGIPKDVQANVFDLFHQEETSLARTQGGLGIGLTLVKRLVELHDGRIEVRSEGRGTGAEFRVILPRAHGRPTEEPADAVRGIVTARSVRVLIVEDNADAAESFKMLLELWGHEVRVVGDGLDALRILDKFDPQIAFVDLGLPGMTGFEVARRFRDDPRAKAALLVALTGYGRDDDKKAALQSGFDHHLVKPVDVEAVTALIASIAGDLRQSMINPPKTLQ